MSLLPVHMAEVLNQLETEWKAGDLTKRGYLKRRGQILAEHPHLREANGTIVFGGGEGVGQVGGATRRLLSLGEEEEERGHRAQVKNLQHDITRAISAWEHLYGPWVSGRGHYSDIMMTSCRTQTTRGGSGGDCRGRG